MIWTTDLSCIPSSVPSVACRLWQPRRESSSNPLTQDNPGDNSGLSSHCPSQTTGRSCGRRMIWMTWTTMICWGWGTWPCGQTPNCSRKHVSIEPHTESSCSYLGGSGVSWGHAHLIKKGCEDHTGGSCSTTDQLSDVGHMTCWGWGTRPCGQTPTFSRKHVSIEQHTERSCLYLGGNRVCWETCAFFSFAAFYSILWVNIPWTGFQPWLSDQPVLTVATLVSPPRSEGAPAVPP
jgi:hypothetical protein